MTGSPLDVLREALATAEHKQFGHDALCRSMFADPGPCNCAVQDYLDARDALAQVATLVEAARELSNWAGIEPGAEDYSIERGYVHDLRRALTPFVSGSEGETA